jgi:hypothetical protein
MPRIMRTKQAATIEIPSGRWREAEARRVLRWWGDSGLSASGFARAHGLNPQRLLWWQKRLKSSEARALAPLTFLPAVVTGAVTATVVRLPGGVVVELADVAAVPTSWIAALAAELRRQS